MKIAFKMTLKPGFAEEYKRRHDAIWPELKELLQKNGIHDYAIFLDEETNTLFAIQEQQGDQSSQQLANHPVMQRWWVYMADIMDTNPDHSPVAVSLKPVFYLE